jgi:hypothetical protein
MAGQGSGQVRLKPAGGSECSGQWLGTLVRPTSRTAYCLRVGGHAAEAVTYKSV